MAWGQTCLIGAALIPASGKAWTRGLTGSCRPWL